MAQLTDKKHFKLARETGEATLVQVARKAQAEGVWLYQGGVFKDVTGKSEPARATFSITPKKKEPFVIYHIHPAAEGSPGGYIDILEGFKVSPPSLEDFQMFVQVRAKFGPDASTKVADGWGVWSFAITEEGLQEEIVKDLDEMTLREWIMSSYIRTRMHTLRQTFEQKLAFRRALMAHGLDVRYDSLNALQGKLIPE